MLGSAIVSTNSSDKSILGNRRQLTLEPSRTLSPDIGRSVTYTDYNNAIPCVLPYL